MIITIHQPNLFPWLGFFDKMLQADIFVLLDTVPYTKGGYQNRTQIKGPNGIKWMTIPVISNGRLGQSTNDVLMVPQQYWRKNHLLTLENFYKKAPYFELIMPKIYGLYTNSTERLSGFTIPGIELIANTLQIGAQLVKSSDLNVSGSGSELLLNIVQSLGGTSYLSGPSGRNYLNLEIFDTAGIKVNFHSFLPFEYPQKNSPFVGGLSALDYLFNQGNKPWWV
jgi:hypothetical protein